MRVCELADVVWTGKKPKWMLSQSITFGGIGISYNVLE